MREKNSLKCVFRCLQAAQVSKSSSEAFPHVYERQFWHPPTGTYPQEQEQQRNPHRQQQKQKYLQQPNPLKQRQEQQKNPPHNEQQQKKYPRRQQ